MTTEQQFERGWLKNATRIDSPNFDDRPDGASIDLMVLHHISLPAGVFSGDGVTRLFTNQIDAQDPLLAELSALRVSAHFFVRRTGEIVQFVDLRKRAWHAGVSCWRGRERCNDFSVGIEIEGDSETAFTREQYQSVVTLTDSVKAAFSVNAMTTHAEIAFGRKIDPGAKFDLSPFKAAFSF